MATSSACRICLASVRLFCILHSEPAGRQVASGCTGTFALQHAHVNTMTRYDSYDSLLTFYMSHLGNCVCPVCFSRSTEQMG